jgi:hypothetical protein
MDFENGSTAAGASWFLNDKLLNLQVSVLFDFKKYNEWQGGHFNSHYEERTNIFFPVILHYNYLRARKATYFASLGIVPGSNYFLDEHNNSQKRNNVPAIAGIGVSRSIFSRLYVRASANIQYVVEIFSPALSFDAIIPLKPRSKVAGPVKAIRFR